VNFSRQRILLKIEVSLVAAVLRNLPEFSRTCRVNLLKCFGFFAAKKTLDLRIGVRIPASQPNIPKHFLKILKLPLDAFVRLLRFTGNGEGFLNPVSDLRRGNWSTPVHFDYTASKPKSVCLNSVMDGR
jgi:hypothetical protein